MRALAAGLAVNDLDRFYSLARAVLVKSETYFDQYDQAFLAAFEGIETPAEIADEVWEWLDDPLAFPGLTDEERRRLVEALGDVDLEALRRLFEERLAEQTEAHHGGSRWVGTGGTSPFGHDGVHPGGIRVGGESRSRTAVKVAAERRYRGYRTDVEVGTRQFELALRRLRQLSSRNEGVPDELDLDETIDETADNAGRLSLVWRKSRKNAVKVLLLMDVGGSMDPYARLCSNLFTAANRSSHFKDLRFYYFHNCVYDWLYTDARLSRPHRRRHQPRPARAVRRLQAHHGRRRRHGEQRAALALRHHLVGRDERGRRASSGSGACARHFDHSVWLNTIPADEWDRAYGTTTIRLIREVFPMFELTVDGLTAAIKKLMVAR